jgi:6-phospho-beta-glucosidase
MCFPSNFLWGAATSAFQYEGAFLDDNKGWNVADERCKARAQKQADNSVAANGYYLWQEDVQLMKELGLTSYRFSISWSRLIPDGDGSVNEKGAEYYANLIHALKQNKIEPVITLLHFDIPWALVEKYGGFLDRRCVDAFERYARICFERFGKEVKYWLTINEQNVMVNMPDMCGIDPKDSEKKLNQINYHMYLASAKAVIAAHEMLENVMIGPCVSYPTIYPETCNPKDVWAAHYMQDFMAFSPMEIYCTGHIPAYTINEWKRKDVLPHMEEEDEDILVRGSADYLGLNWYCTTTVSHACEKPVFNIGVDAQMIVNPYLEYGEYGWSYDPIGLRIALRECYARFKKPLMICENGWSEVEELSEGKIHDAKRVSYLKDHVAQMSAAIDDGVELIGYQHWSFIDVLSSSQGFRKRYGLVYVDRDEFDCKQCTRYKKDSFYAYQKIIQHNGLLPAEGNIC